MEAAGHIGAKQHSVATHFGGAQFLFACRRMLRLTDVFQRVDYFRAEKHDIPADVQSQEKKRQGREAAVNGVIGGHVYLEFDVPGLEELIGRSGRDGRQKGVSGTNSGIRHDHVKKREKNPEVSRCSGAMCVSKRSLSK